MASLEQGGHHPSLVQYIPWPRLPGNGEQYPLMGTKMKCRQVDLFVRAYSAWKSCSEDDIRTHMLPGWVGLNESSIASQGKAKKDIKRVVNFLAKSA